MLSDINEFPGEHATVHDPENCIRKVRLPNRLSALEATAAMWNTKRQRVWPYQCEVDHSHYHVGSRNYLSVEQEEADWSIVYQLLDCYFILSYPKELGPTRAMERRKRKLAKREIEQKKHARKMKIEEERRLQEWKRKGLPDWEELKIRLLDD